MCEYRNKVSRIDMQNQLHSECSMVDIVLSSPFIHSRTIPYFRLALTFAKLKELKSSIL